MDSNLFILIILIISFISIIFIPLIFIIRSSIKRKGKMGINLQEVKCPKCGEIAPIFRKPASFSEFMFGGWTCSNCRCKMDKWGNKR